MINHPPECLHCRATRPATAAPANGSAFHPVEWLSMDPQLQSFEEAFALGIGSCRVLCHCGREFFNDDECGSSWDAGELEGLRENPNAYATDYSISLLGFEGLEFANACDCWHPRARKIINWIDNHGHKIANYLTAEKKRLLAEAEAAPEIK